MALSLFRLVQFYLAEVHRGNSGVGNYTLRAGLTPTTSAVTPMFGSVLLPSDIVDVIRGGGKSSPATSCSTTAAITSLASSSISPKTTVPAAVISTESTSHVSLTCAERAWSLVNSGNISLNPKLAVFTVVGTTEPRLVKLFPATSCTCPAITNCYHVKAAQIAVEIYTEPVRRQLNVTQLRRNKRKKADKTAGRKRPRRRDVDVIPAGDTNDDALHNLLRVVSATQEEAPEESQLQPIVSQQVAATSDEPRSSAQSSSLVASSAASPDSRCPECGFEDPPNSKSHKVNWIQCDQCTYWFHQSCIKRVITSNKFICRFCKH